MKLLAFLLFSVFSLSAFGYGAPAEGGDPNDKYLIKTAIEADAAKANNHTVQIDRASATASDCDSNNVHATSKSPRLENDFIPGEDMRMLRDGRTGGKTVMLRAPAGSDEEWIVPIPESFVAAFHPCK